MIHSYVWMYVMIAVCNIYIYTVYDYDIWLCDIIWQGLSSPCHRQSSRLQKSMNQVCSSSETRTCGRHVSENIRHVDRVSAMCRTSQPCCPGGMQQQKCFLPTIKLPDTTNTFVEFPWACVCVCASAKRCKECTEHEEDLVLTLWLSDISLRTIQRHAKVTCKGSMQNLSTESTVIDPKSKFFPRPWWRWLLAAAKSSLRWPRDI